MKFDIRVCGVQELGEQILMSPASVVSIWDIGSDDTGSYLDLFTRHLPGVPVEVAKFDDISSPEKGRRLVTKRDVQKILNFAKSAQFPLLVHCRAGISRSAAVAYAILCQSLGPGKEDDCMQRLAEIRPQSVPNHYIVELADEALGRGGEMVRAYRSFMRKYLIEGTEP